MKKDWTNQKFGLLIILTSTEEKRGGKYLWKALCECGKECLILPGDCAAGKTRSCGCLQRQAAHSVGLKNRQYDPMISSARNIWHNVYKDGDLLFEDFLRLALSPCYYCGALPSRTYNVGNQTTKDGARSDYQKDNGDFTYNGLDRLDSTKSHTLCNVVPCCSKCNTAKLRMSLDEFLTHVERIYEHTRPLRQATISP